MPVRTFDGIDNRIAFALGATGIVMGPVTIAMIVRRGHDTGTEAVMRVGASGLSTARYGLEILTTALQVRSANNLLSAPTITATVADSWVLLAVSKANGTVTPRFHKSILASSTHTHEDGASTLANSTAPTAGPVIGAAANGTSPYQGDVAIAAIWNVVLTDSQVEALIQSQAAWRNVAPVALWVLDQTSTATSVPDIVGTSSQSSITGTSVTLDGVPFAAPSPLVMAPRIST